MSAKIFYDKDVSLDPLKKLQVAVIGYGNQGRAHALNLKDSGISVIIGARSGGKAWQQALVDGFEPMTIDEACRKADVIALLLPDEQVPIVYKQSIEPALDTPRTFVFAHGFVVTNKTIKLPSDADVLLVAPTGPGRQVRSLYEEGKGLPALIAVEQNPSGNGMTIALAYAKAIGCTRAGAIKTTFAEETVTDLFCEQAVLCGGMPELIKASFDTLVARGYQPELAYISCLKEVKLIADLLFTQGMDGMRKAISNTAKYGSVVAGPAIINEPSKKAIATILSDIESGAFAKNFIQEAADGMPATRAYSEQEADSKLAHMGRELAKKLEF